MTAWREIDKVAIPEDQQRPLENDRVIRSTTCINRAVELLNISHQTVYYIPMVRGFMHLVWGQTLSVDGEILHLRIQNGEC